MAGAAAPISGNGVPVSFYYAVLRALHAPVTHANLAALEAWHQHELSIDRWNPFNTTLGEPGAVSTNSVGVKSYPNEQTGLRATISTLKMPAYRGIVAALRKGNNPNAVGAAVGASPWGTPTFTVGGGGGGGIISGAESAGSSLLHGITGIPGDVTGAASSAASSVGGVIIDGLFRLVFVGVGLVLIVLGLLQLFGVKKEDVANVARMAAESGAAA